MTARNVCVQLHVGKEAPNRTQPVHGRRSAAAGTVDHTPVYPREVVKHALELSATAIILVYNRPSGAPTS